MKLLLLMLAAVLVPLSTTQAQKVGADSDTVRQILFANQSIKEQAKHVTLDGTDSPFQRIVDASKFLDEGKKTEAVAKLRSILQMQPLQTRAELWTWSDLRELGEKPHDKAVMETLGVILEIPVKGAYDTLAAYADGSACYLNYSGAALFWETPDATIKNLCRDFIASADALSVRGKPRLDDSLPRVGAQATLLTRSGNFVITQPSPAVINAGAKLMNELIHRATKKKEPAPAGGAH